MIKKASRRILKLVLGIVLLTAIAYGTFHLWEYATGGKYVKYLKENCETVNLNESFTYNIIKTDIDKSKLILVGEIHGTEEPSKFDVGFFKYLNENYGVRHYLAELDFVQAEYLNQFMVNKDHELLKNVLKRWVVVQGRSNQDYFNKYLKFQELYEILPEDQKFRFIGIDRIQDWELTTSYLNDLIPKDSPLPTIEFKEDGIQETLIRQIDMLNQYYADDSTRLVKLASIKSNIEMVQMKKNREDILFDNFKTFYNTEGIKSQKLYGYFGLFHIFQYRVNGKHPLASKIRMSDLELENKILSINFMLNDSYMVMPSKTLPEFLRDKGKYTRMPLSADNMLVMYIYGIKDLKRTTGKQQKSLIKMNGVDNPYANSNRLNSSFQILPVTDLFEMTDKGKPYVQYTVFVRNSDWAEPMKE